MRWRVKAPAGPEDEAGRLGSASASAETLALGETANRIRRSFIAFDRYGQRIDEVEFHPAYHRLMGSALAPASRMAGSGSGRRTSLHAALEYLMAQAEPGVCCPMTMTYAAVRR